MDSNQITNIAGLVAAVTYTLSQYFPEYKILQILTAVSLAVIAYYVGKPITIKDLLEKKDKIWTK